MKPKTWVLVMQTEAALQDCQKRQRTYQRRKAECSRPDAYFFKCFHDTPRTMRHAK
jgi:hypothetical protein